MGKIECIHAPLEDRERPVRLVRYLNNRNDNPTPYVLTKTVAQILSKIARAKQALELQH
jgi:hypothetical protein